VTYQRVSTGSPFEASIGFSRAVRSGSWIAVSGTAPLDADGKTAHVGDVYAQTRRCLQIMVRSVEQAGGSIDGVIRTRIMLTNIRRWQEAARAHDEFFGEIPPRDDVRPSCRVHRPEWLVETEADCVVRAA
jgi:enamine deaminase RidA (YjgF/YER057c/UK114 family)